MSRVTSPVTDAHVTGLFVVTETPALLAGMPLPADDTDWRALHRLGFRHVIRLHPREGAVVHCLGGTGRTGTVLACALQRLGWSADEAIAAVRAHRPRWPESPWQEEVVRSAAMRP